MSKMIYTFTSVESCDMCGQSKSKAVILGQRLNQSQGLKPKTKTGITVTVLQCTQCHLIYSDPRPAPVNIQDHYGVPPEKYWTEKYFQVNPDYFRSQSIKAKELVAFEPGMKALDIGAGVGKAMIAMRAAGFDTYGLEPSEPFRERAIARMNIPAEALRAGMIEEIDYHENSFDFISFGAVLEHLYEPSKCIERALKWLRPGGVMYINVPSSRWLIPTFYNAYFRLIGTNYVTNLSPMHEPFHLYEFDVRSFEALAKKLPFEIAYLQRSVCSIYHIPKVFHPMLKWYMDKTDRGMEMTIWLRKK